MNAPSAVLDATARTIDPVEATFEETPTPAPKGVWQVFGNAHTVIQVPWKGDRLVDNVQVIDPSQAWFWTPGWQAGEIRADLQADAGEGVLYDNIDDFLNDLP